jgi:hypothetical protein
VSRRALHLARRILLHQWELYPSTSSDFVIRVAGGSCAAPTALGARFAALMAQASFGSGWAGTWGRGPNTARYCEAVLPFSDFIIRLKIHRNSYKLLNFVKMHKKSIKMWNKFF